MRGRIAEDRQLLDLFMGKSGNDLDRAREEKKKKRENKGRSTVCKMRRCHANGGKEKNYQAARTSQTAGVELAVCHRNSVIVVPIQ